MKKTLSIITVVVIFIMELFVLIETVGPNQSKSLPYDFFYKYRFSSNDIEKNDLVRFDSPKNSVINKNYVLVKRICGVAGDEVFFKDNTFYINGLVLVAKSRTTMGRQLIPLRTKSFIIPNGKIFVCTPHKDSYDSRYQEFGLIDIANTKKVYGGYYPW